MTGSFFTTVKRWRINSPRLSVWECSRGCSGCPCIDRGVRAHSDSLRTEINLTNVTRSLSTFEADSPCQSALCVRCGLFYALAVTQRAVCVWCWVPPSSFLPGKALLSLLALPVMPLPSPLICTTRLSETKWDGLVDTSLSVRMRGD